MGSLLTKTIRFKATSAWAYHGGDSYPPAIRELNLDKERSALIIECIVFNDGDEDVQIIFQSMAGPTGPSEPWYTRGSATVYAKGSATFRGAIPGGDIYWKFLSRVVSNNTGRPETQGRIEIFDLSDALKR